MTDHVTAEVEFPDGRKATVTGPTREAVMARIEILRAESSIPEQQPPERPTKPSDFRGGGTAGVAEGVASVVSKIAGMSIGGIAGIATLPFGNDIAVDVSRSVADFLSFDPQTDVGRATAAGLSRGAAATVKPFRSVAGAVATTNLEPDSPDSFRMTEEEKQVTKDRINEEGIGPFLGDAVLETTDSPLAATIADTLPAAVGAAVGVRNPFRSTPKTPPPKPVNVDKPGSVSVGKPSLDSPVDITPPVIDIKATVSSEKIIKNLQANKPANVAQEVLPDIQIIESAQRLGINLNPEHYSTNIAFQSVARALKSQGGSILQANEVAALRALSKEADDLVLEMGGKLDKAGVSESIRLEVVTKIDEMSAAAKKGYKAVDDAIPAATLVDTQFIRGFLDNRIAELGGNAKLLNAPEKALVKLIGTVKKPLTPTYKALDRVRKEVGRGFQRRGKFADEAQASLSEIYGVLSDVQQSIANAFPGGIGETYTAAKALVQTRKALEDSAVAMFGPKLVQSLVPMISAAARGLGTAKGDVSAFHKLMSTIPKGRQAEVAATVLGELFALGSRQGGNLGTGFTNVFAALQRNHTARNALFKWLTPDQVTRFTDIGRVMTGIVKSNSKPLANPSGTAAGVIKAIDDQTMLSKIYQVAPKLVATELAASTFGMGGFASASAIGGIIQRGKTPVSVAADQMLASPAFAQAIGKAMQGNVKVADNMIKSSPAFKKWVTTIDPKDAARIAKIGFTGWIIEEDQN